MACTAREDKRNYVCAFPHGVVRARCQLGGLTTGHAAILYGQDLGTRFCFVFFFPKYKGQTIKATPPCWTTRCPLAKQWCLCCPMSFSSLQSNVSALNSNESCWECIPVSHSMSRTGLIQSGYCQCPLSLRGRQWAGIPAVVFNPKMRGFPSLRLLAGILRIEG